MSSSHNNNFSSAPAQPPLPLRYVLNKERRTWTRAEEDALIIFLKKLVVDGWRQENAFRTGYLEVVEKELHTRFPGTDLTSANATSKLTVWKKKYSIVLNMINTSGFGWNDSNHMISVDDGVWQQYVKVHPQAKTLRFKSYRYFHDWVGIFGKDRATGKNAQGPEDLAKAANEEPYRPYFDVDEFPPDYNVHLQGDFNSNHNEHIRNEFPHKDAPVEEKIADTPYLGECKSVNMKKKDGGKKTQSTRKRSRLDSLSKELVIVNLMDEFFKQHNESIDILVDILDKRSENSTNSKLEVVDKTKLVLEALSKLGTLTEETRLYFTYKIAIDASVMDLFLNFSEHERVTFVNMIMTNKVW